MQKCDSCDTPFKWTIIYKSLFWGYKPIQCNKCGINYKIAFSSRFIVVSLTILPMLIIGKILSPFNNIFSTILIGLTIATIGSLFTPYLVKYKKLND